MLRLGLSLCEQIVGADPSEDTEFSLSNLISRGRLDWSGTTGLIDSNGDAEMWLRLCNLGNRQVVRVADGGTWTSATDPGDLKLIKYRLYWGSDPNGVDSYGANPVMDHLGNVHNGLTSDNLFPICVSKPSDPTQAQIATSVLQAKPVLGKNVIPFCPDGFVQASHKLTIDPRHE